MLTVTVFFKKSKKNFQQPFFLIEIKFFKDKLLIKKKFILKNELLYVVFLTRKGNLWLIMYVCQKKTE